MSQKKTSPVTNPDQDMQVLADNLWSYFEPKIKSLLSSGVSYYRAQVTQAASGGTITVQRPFDQTQLALPYVSSAEGLEVGRQVTVLVLGSQSNAIVLGNGTLSNLLPKGKPALNKQESSSRPLIPKNGQRKLMNSSMESVKSRIFSAHT